MVESPEVPVWMRYSWYTKVPVFISFMLSSLAASTCGRRQHSHHASPDQMFLIGTMPLSLRQLAMPAQQIRQYAQMFSCGHSQQICQCRNNKQSTVEAS